MSKLICSALSNRVLSIANAVHRNAGAGLLESAYEEAFCVELEEAGIPFERQKVFPFIYKGRQVRGYIADIVVDDTVILELKAVTQLSTVHSAQLINYLKLSGLPVGYLFNFNAFRLEFKRYVNTTGRRLMP
ncbi:MAG: GxxExxY protein [Spirochaetales bacterium]|nr:GxxExxY protein [Spirochaetales bacterium]